MAEIWKDEDSGFPNRLSPERAEAKALEVPGAQIAHVNAPSCEVIDSAELARRWAVKPSWIKEQVRSRAIDPLPHVKLGRYVRFEWGAPQLQAWFARRRCPVARPLRFPGRIREGGAR